MTTLRLSSACFVDAFPTTRSIICYAPALQISCAEILRVPCLTEDQWEQASLPVKLSGLGVNQTKVIAGPAYVGSCCLTKDLVAALLKQDSSSFEPSDVKGLLAAHEVATGITHELAALSDSKKVQHLLSSERHEATFKRLKSKLGVRTHNLMLACSMSHASDWLFAPPIPGLGLSLQSDAFRTALKFRLSMPLFDKPFACPAASAREPFVMPRWTFSAITRCAASTVPPWCFGTTTSGTFSGTRQELLVSRRS